MKSKTLVKWLSVIALLLVILNHFVDNSFEWGLLHGDFGTFGVLILAIIAVILAFGKNK